MPMTGREKNIANADDKIRSPVNSKLLCADLRSLGFSANMKRTGTELVYSSKRYSDSSLTAFQLHLANDIQRIFDTVTDYLVAQSPGHAATSSLDELVERGPSPR
ncbi:hypothetical protein WN48_03672 [Eufriesea mexicana]|nr:hypothetical protein WN48_03672 [Eufriesea mexicana]